MSNPLTHVGQTARPEDSLELQQHCQQVQAQQQAAQQQGQSTDAKAGVGGSQQMGGPAQEPSATRLPQHPQQQQESAAPGSIGQQRIRQQGETRAEDTSLPSPTDAD